jgi:phosphatidate cytidylyltransferase
VSLSNHTVRVLVALVAIPLIIVLAMAGGVYFFALVAVISAVALTEFYALAKAKGAFPQVALGLLFGFSVNAVFLHRRIQHAVVGIFQEGGVAVPFPSMAQLLMILSLLFIPLMLILELFRRKGSPVLNLATTLFGVGYVSFLLGTFIGVRELFHPDDLPLFRYFGMAGASVPDEVVRTIDRWGGATVMSILASIWICDSAAYYVGSAAGKHKLFERVSPKKSWEGAVGGILAALASFVAAKFLVLPYLSVTNALVCGAIVGVFGQVGDLAESLLKRDAGVKDSSSLIPGHGGALDRFDSLLFVSPLVFVYLDFILFSQW